MRYFNTTGPIRSDEHYALPLRLDSEKLHKFISRGQYFVLHAPRQTGKTTAIFEFIKILRQKNTYTPLYINVEPAQVARGNVKDGMKTLINLFKIEIHYQYGPHDPSLLLFDQTFEDPYSALYEFLRNWSQSTQKPIILFIDEIDSLIGDTLISVLRQIRTGYASRPKAFPLSICLIGVRDVKDYKIFSEEQQSMVIGGSAFNIKAASLILDSFSLEEVRTLYLQHTQDTGQVFTEDAISYAFNQTQGQPWLTNALANEVTSKVCDRSRPITKDAMEQAREILILRRDTHLDVLLDRLKEERIANIVDAILSANINPPPFLSEDVKYATDLGLISEQNGVLQIANPIYREIIPRELTSARQQSFIQERASYFKADGSLDMQKLLSEFTQFYRENSAITQEEMLYRESGPHLLLMAYLQRIVNGGGRIHREYALGRGRVDLFVEYKKQKIVLELKIYRSPKTLTEGLEQTTMYMKTQGSTEGHLILFDNSTKSWDKKIYHKVEEVDSCKIDVWGM